MSKTNVKTSRFHSRPISQTVHREEEWKIVDSEIIRQRNTPASYKSIIVFYGTAGIGKSTLLNQTLIPRIRENYPSLPIISINFDKDFANHRYDSPSGRGQFIIDLISQLEEQSAQSFEKDKAFRKWQRLIPEIEKRKLTKSLQTKLENAEKDLIDILIKSIFMLSTTPEKLPVIIVTDTIEQVERDYIGWIQEKIQPPTTDRGFVLWIMASRQPLDCQPFFLRPRYLWSLLKPFKEQEIRDQVSEHPDLAHALRQFSFGLPAATTRLAEAILEIEIEKDKPVSPEDFEDKAIQDRLVISLEDLLKLHRYMGSLDQNLVKGLEILSPLRLFNVAVVTELLPQWLPEYFKPSTIGADALYEIQKMVQTRLVSWDRSRRGFVFEEPIRQIVALILKHNNPDKFIAIQRWAADQYLTWAENIESKRIDYIVEALYHKLCILKLEKDQDPTNKIIEVLGEMIGKYYRYNGIHYAEALVELKEQLESDGDFNELLNPDEIHRLLETINE